MPGDGPSPPDRGCCCEPGSYSRCGRVGRPSGCWRRGQNGFQRRDVDFRVACDSVGAAGVQLLERVGRIAGEHHVLPVVLDADHSTSPGV